MKNKDASDNLQDDSDPDWSERDSIAPTVVDTTDVPIVDNLDESASQAQVSPVSALPLTPVATCCSAQHPNLFLFLSSDGPAPDEVISGRSCSLARPIPPDIENWSSLLRSHSPALGLAPLVHCPSLTPDLPPALVPTPGNPPSPSHSPRPSGKYIPPRSHILSLVARYEAHLASQLPCRDTPLPAPLPSPLLAPFPPLRFSPSPHSPLPPCFFSPAPLPVPLLPFPSPKTLSFPSLPVPASGTHHPSSSQRQAFRYPSPTLPTHVISQPALSLPMAPFVAPGLAPCLSGPSILCWTVGNSKFSGMAGIWPCTRTRQRGWSLCPASFFGSFFLIGS